jgi:dihydroxyacetone kinase-like predicted kinase
LLHVVDGRTLPEPVAVLTPAVVQAHHDHQDDSALRYEVMYFLDADDSTIPAFKDAWGAIGDSIVVVGGEGLWNCHVHTNDIGAAIEAGIEAGKPNKIRVTDLIEQVEEEQWVRDRAGTPAMEPSNEPVTTAVVAVAVGDGLKRLLTSLGVHRIVAGGQSMNPSTAQILDAVDSCNSNAVIVLPNNKNIVPVAQQVDALTPRDVQVVPTTAVVEALAALVAFDPDADVKTNATAMEDTIARVRAGEVTQAVREAQSDVGPISTGDWIALSRKGICAKADSALAVAKLLVDSLVDDESEIVTIVMGLDARPADKAALQDYLALHHGQLEIEVHDGGQPLYPYLIGVE